MQFYSYVTENPKAFGLTDDPLGTMGKSIDRDLNGTTAIVLGRCPNPHYVKLLVNGRTVPVFEDFVEVQDEEG